MASAKVANFLVRRPALYLYKYLKQVSFDYRDALIESGRKALQHPFKALFYTSNVSLLIYAYRTMPSFNSYKNTLIDIRQQQIFTSSLIRNRQSEIYFDTIEQLLLENQIHFVDCYLFSLIIYRKKHQTTDSSYKFYENLCSYLHRKRDARIIDIGFFNRWYRLKQQSHQADIEDDKNNKNFAL